MDGSNGAGNIQSRTPILAILCQLYLNWNLHSNQLVYLIDCQKEEAYQQIQRESQLPLSQQDIMQDIKEILES